MELTVYFKGSKRRLFRTVVRPVGVDDQTKA